MFPQALIDLAVGLYVEQRATLGRAAKIAGLSQADFLRRLGDRKIPVHYDEEDLSSDIEAIKQL